MIAHVTAAALCSENKVLSHPASVDSIPTSAGTEDHVSMGMSAALKLRQVVENVATILAIELMVAAQALEFSSPSKAGNGVIKAFRHLRKTVPAVREDVQLAPLIDAARKCMWAIPTDLIS
jgi:histidine ammonia-lyase